MCLEGVFPHSVSTKWDPCVRVYVPLTLPPSPRPHEKINLRGGDPALHLSQARGHLNWRIGLPVLLGSHLGCWIVHWFPLILHSLWAVSHAEYIMALRPYSVFRHFTAFYCQGLPPFSHWATIWTNIDVLLIGTLGYTSGNLNHKRAISIQRHAFKISSTK